MRTERHITQTDVARRAAPHDLQGRGERGPRPALTTLFFLLFAVSTTAQVGVTTFGIQLKPVIPLEFFDPLTTISQEPLMATVELEQGFAFGMVIRHGITKSISLETGINQIRRRYAFNMMNDTNGYENGGNLRFTGYEIPVMGLVYVRLGERTYMNNAVGVSLDAYPSEVVKSADRIRGALIRSNWAQLGVVGNIGVEYRTEKSGIIYIGATYHRPFNAMARAQMTYFDQGIVPYELFADIDGSYLTVDLRYFFHEDPNKYKPRN